MKTRLSRFVVLWLALALTLPVSAAYRYLPLVRTPSHRVIWANFLGLNAQPLWFTAGQYKAQFRALKALGLDWIRIGIHWARMTAPEGQFHYRRLDTLIRVIHQMHLHTDIYLVGSARFDSTVPPGAAWSDQYPPRNDVLFARQLGALARRYPSVDAWEVWNEENLPAFWHDPGGNRARDYGQLLRESYQVLKQTGVHSLVVLGGMAYYSQMPGRGHPLMFKALARLGLLRAPLVAAYHPYTHYPDGRTPDTHTYLARSQTLNHWLHQAGIRQIWANEWGWSSYGPPAVDQPVIGRDGQAEDTLKRLALMSTQTFERIFLFTLSDLDRRASRRDQHYGLLTLSGKRKPVYVALQRYLRFTGGAVAPATLPGMVSNVPGVDVVAYREKDGRLLLVYWGHHPGILRVKATRGTLVDPLSGKSVGVTSHHGRVSLPVISHLEMFRVLRNRSLPAHRIARHLTTQLHRT